MENADLDTTMNELSNPESLRDHADVEFDEKTTIVEEDELESLESNDGVVIAGVTDVQTRILLVDFDADWSHGWTLPGAPVKPDEDWIDVARQWVEDQTGVGVQIDRPERVVRTDYRLEDGTRQHTRYNLFLSASVGPNSEPSDVTDGNEDGPAADWFDEVPENAADDLEQDVLLFFPG